MVTPFGGIGGMGQSPSMTNPWQNAGQGQGMGNPMFGPGGGSGQPAFMNWYRALQQMQNQGNQPSAGIPLTNDSIVAGQSASAGNNATGNTSLGLPQAPSPQPPTSSPVNGGMANNITAIPPFTGGGGTAPFNTNMTGMPNTNFTGSGGTDASGGGSGISMTGPGGSPVWQGPGGQGAQDMVNMFYQLNPSMFNSLSGGGSGGSLPQSGGGIFQPGNTGVGGFGGSSFPNTNMTGVGAGGFPFGGGMLGTQPGTGMLATPPINTL